MKRLLCLCAGLLLMSTLPWLTAARNDAPSPEKLGYKPSFEVTYFSSLEYRYLLSELLFYDAAFYYGTILEKPGQRPDYVMMGRYIDYATRLNAFNIDAYYLGQAILVWEGGLVKDMNVMLERGFKRRNWDFYLPFFLGFNHAYFLNDPKGAAQYMSQAAKLNPRMTFLPTYVGRLYYEADKTEQAIQYLKVVYEGTFDQKLRKSILVRISALESIQFLEGAVRKFEQKTGRRPAELDELVTAGILKGIPPDPYGGRFFYDRSDGRVKTSSKMALQGAKNDRH